MLDIKWVRENPGLFDESMRNRNSDPCSEKILSLDKRNRGIISKIQFIQARRNEIASLIGVAKKNGQNATELETESSKLKSEMASLEQEQEKFSRELTEILSSLPNIPLADVPVGKDESANKCVRVVGEIPKFDFKPKHHYELGEDLGLIDFQTAAKVSGSRFTILKGAISKMERALKSFMLDNHTQNYGYQ